MNWYKIADDKKFVWHKPVSEAVETGNLSFLWDQYRNPTFSNLPEGYEVVQYPNNELAVVAPADYEGQPDSERREIVRKEFGGDNFWEALNAVVESALQRIRFIESNSNRTKIKTTQDRSK